MFKPIKGAVYLLKGKTTYNHFLTMGITVIDVDGENFTFKDSITEIPETQNIESFTNTWEVKTIIFEDSDLQRKYEMGIEPISADVIGDAITEPESIEVEDPKISPLKEEKPKKAGKNK